MGGGGTFYGRDTTDRKLVRTTGFSDKAEEALSRTRLDPVLLPGSRILTAGGKSPIVLELDATGSMGRFPRTLWDKMPMVAGEIVKQGYIEEPLISLAVTGDLISDEAPIQICDFSLIRNLDDWLQRLYLEGNGGGQAKESYELTAYFYARRCELPDAETPVFIIIGDEGFREKLYASEIKKYIDGEHADVGSEVVYDELKDKFKGNVFLIHRRYSYRSEDGKQYWKERYGREDAEIVKQWQEVLGKEKVLILGDDDMAIGDIILGILALVTGVRTLKDYLADMQAREQTEKRIAQVEESLQPLAAALNALGPSAKPKASKTKVPGETEGSAKKQTPKTKKKKVGSL